MVLMPVILRSLVKLVSAVMREPTASVTTMLYYSNQLPRNLNLERFVRHEFLRQDGLFFHFLIGMLRCLW
ncbi:hypothetical protein L6164_004402 [Bauhinia variegata]|uniref:Uncharacterized protein n=1 Tax=Bauhinia variegata TaxID=167791 RepID=A0ACB9Q6I4_BAUVA|nr:hypothetical protein L6164_004402 [Bauhinia variegata]